MKFLLFFLLLQSSSQTVFYNMPNEQYYVIDLSQDPVQILVISENIEIEISCIQNQVKKCSNVNFTSASHCLMNSLNQAFDLNITNYVDLKNDVSNEKLTKIKNDKNLQDILPLMMNIDHSYSISDLFTTYAHLSKNGFRYEIHSLFYIIVDQVYIPLSIN